MDRLPSPLAALFASLSAEACDTAGRPRWQGHFDAHGVRGTCVVFEPARDRYLVLDGARARRRLLAGATFHAAAAVIGVELGAIGDEREVFRWDGRPRLRGAWERDHTLASGMREGAVWMFQEVARRVGKARMREWLDRLDYGNRDIAGGIDLFWLQGGLRVSAFEQVAFLHKLAEGRLAATQRAQRLAREAMVVERTREYTLRAVSGSSGHARDPVAWWTGWMERKGRPVACFAINYAPGPDSRAEARFAIGRAILHEAAGLPMEPPAS